MDENSENQPAKSLRQRFNDALSESNRRQFKAGLAVTAFAYAAAGGLTALGAEPMAGLTQSLLFSASWKVVPFHVLFVGLASTAGASAMAIYDWRQRRAARSVPQP